MYQPIWMRPHAEVDPRRYSWIICPNPHLLLQHNIPIPHASATLITHPHWHCLVVQIVSHSSDRIETRKSPIEACLPTSSYEESDMSCNNIIEQNCSARKTLGTVSKKHAWDGPNVSSHSEQRMAGVILRAVLAVTMLKQNGYHCI